MLGLKKYVWIIADKITETCAWSSSKQQAHSLVSSSWQCDCVHFLYAIAMAEWRVNPIQKYQYIGWNIFVNTEVAAIGGVLWKKSCASSRSNDSRSNDPKSFFAWHKQIGAKNTAHIALKSYKILLNNSNRV